MRRELAVALDKFAHSRHVKLPFDTYSNGEQRSEQKTVAKHQQQAVIASVADALLKDK